MDCNLLDFRNQILMILWTRRRRLSFRTTGDCSSKMLENLCEVEVSMVCTLRGVTSEMTPRNETSTGKKWTLLCCESIVSTYCDYLLVYLFMQSDPSVFKLNNSLKYKFCHKQWTRVEIKLRESPSGYKFCHGKNLWERCTCSWYIDEIISLWPQESIIPTIYICSLKLADSNDGTIFRLQMHLFIVY